MKLLTHLLFCGFILWMENSKGEYEPIVGFETRQECVGAIKVAKEELGPDIFLTCFPTGFEPRIEAVRDKPVDNPAELSHP